MGTPAVLGRPFALDMVKAEISVDMNKLLSFLSDTITHILCTPLKDVPFDTSNMVCYVPLMRKDEILQNFEQLFGQYGMKLSTSSEDEAQEHYKKFEASYEFDKMKARTYKIIDEWYPNLEDAVAVFYDYAFEEVIYNMFFQNEKIKKLLTTEVKDWKGFQPKTEEAIFEFMDSVVALHLLYVKISELWTSNRCVHQRHFW